MSGQRRLRLGVSACLLGEEVRYDGQHKRQAFLTEAWLPHVDVVSFCPEVAMGLGVPRMTVELRADAAGVLTLRQTGSGTDLSLKARDASQQGLSVMRSAGVDGFVLKARSPSCGPGDAPVLQPDSTWGSGRGMFAEAIASAFQGYAIASESELQTPLMREAFLGHVEVLRDLREQQAAGRPLSAALRRHRTLLRARGETAPLGVGDAPQSEWLPRLHRALRRIPLRSDHERALLSLIESAGPSLSPPERAAALQGLAEFSMGAHSLWEALAPLRSAVRGRGLERFLDDSYLWPGQPRAGEYRGI